MSLTRSLPPHRGSFPPQQLSVDAAPQAAHRDRVLDLLRFGCLIVVVILHSLMSAAVLADDGTVVPTVALTGTVGFAAASWLFQIMPLFFVIGGYAGLSGWRRAQARGGTWADYLRSRLRRLVVPVTVLIGAAGLGLSIAAELGVSPDLLAAASLYIGRPLWFLAVYVGLTSLIPVAVHFHDRAPRRTIAALAGAVVFVDSLVEVTGITGFGYLNFLFVWPLIQQAGFFFADARRRPPRRRMLWTVMLSALVGLGLLVALGVYSPNMLVNLNPPTGALALLGLAQLCALLLSHGWLTSVIAGGRGSAGVVAHRAEIWERVIAWGNDFGIQVYLWHMSVVITLIGGLAVLGQVLAGVPIGGATVLADLILPEVGSLWWWITRVSWLFTVMGISALVAMAVSKIPFISEARLEDVGEPIGRVVRRVLGSKAPRLISDYGRAVLAVGLAVVGIGIALLVGIAPLMWTLVAILLLMGSLILSAGLRTRLGVPITGIEKISGRGAEFPTCTAEFAR